MIIVKGEIWLTADALDAESRNFDAATRRKYADSGIALPDGSFPIPDKDALRRAISSVGRGSDKGRARRHIIKRAKALGATGMLPEDWGVAAEMKSEIDNIVKLPEIFHFESFLTLDGKTLPFPLILEAVTDEEKEKEANGTLKVKMPFYVSEATAKLPDISKKVYFPGSILSEIISEGKRQIAEGRQPLTVYSRHAHAIANDRLPIGAIVDFQQEGRIGYAILEIEPTTEGKDAQTLLKAKPPKLNAISLRSGPGRFELEEAQVNGEIMYKPRKLFLDGVDFAPDKPALGNYGVEILAAEASVKPVEKTKEKEVQLQVGDELTLEAVKGRPDILQEIEKPLLAMIEAEKEKSKNLTAELDSLKKSAARSELNAYVAEMASKHPKKEEALKIFAEIAKDCATKEEFAGKILPYFVNATVALKPAEKSVTLEDQMKALFHDTKSVSLVDEEEPKNGDNLTAERVGVLEVPE